MASATVARKRVKVAPGLFQRPRDGKYECGHTGTDGKYHLVTLAAGNLTEAKRAQRELLSQVDKGEAVAPSRMTLADVAADYFLEAEARVKSGEMASRTLSNYRQRWNTHLEPKLGTKKVQQIQAPMIGAALRDLRGTDMSSWTLQGILTAAGAIFAHAVARGWIQESPTRRLTKGERPRPRNKRTARLLTPKEVSTVVAATTERWKPLLLTASLTGARISELLGLRWQDLDLVSPTLSISITTQLGRDGKLARPKTDRSVRTIKVGSELRRVLLAHYMASTDKTPGAFVFSHFSAAAPDYHNARRALALAIKEAGITYDKKEQRVGFHGFRHGAVSALIRAGVDPVRVAKYVGDRVETILSTYAHEWEAQGDDNLGDVLGAAMTTGGQ